LVGKPKGKRPLGRPRRRWEEKIDKIEIVPKMVLGLIWLTIRNMAVSCECGIEPSDSIKFWEFVE
jgi:hypothetical protein